MDPLAVYCANCFAVPWEMCVTIQGNARSPHAPRVKLAAHPDECPDCGADYGEPCLKETGEVRFYPHQNRTRTRAHANS